MSVVSVSTVFSSNSAALGLNDRVASFMDHLFATGVGLSTRYFIDLVTGHDLKLVGSLIGIWEGIVMQHFVKRNRRSRKVFDPYLAFAVRLFLDYALTQDPSRLALTVVWSCLGWVLADLVPQVLKELGLGGFWKSIERDLDNLSRSIPSIPATSGSRSTRVHSSSRPPSHVTEVRSMSMASYPTTITPVSSHGSSFTRSQPATAVRRRPPGALPGYASSNTTGMTPQASMRSPDYNSSQSASLSSLSFSGPSLLGTAHATSHFTYTTQHTGTRTRGHDASTRFTDDLDGENLSSSTSSAGSASTRIATIDRSGIHPGDIPDEELEIPISQSPGGSFVTPVRRIQGHLPTPSATASARHSRQGPVDPELRQSMATEEPPSFADMRTIRTMPSGKTLKELEGSPSRGSRHTSIASPSRSIHTSSHHEEVADQAPVAPLTPPKKVSNPRDVPTPASAGKSSTTPSGIPRIRQPQPPQRKASVGSGVPSMVASIPEPQPQPPPQPQPVQAPIQQRISQVQQQDTQTPVETTVSPAPLPIPPAQGRSGGGSHHERAPSALASSASADNQAQQQQQPPPSSQSRIPLPTPVKAQSVVVGPTSSGKGKEREPADKAGSVVSMPALSKSQTKGGSGQSQKPVDNAPATASAPAPPAATANKGISRPPSTTGVPPPPPATEPQPQSQPKSKSQAEAPSQAQGEQAPKPQPPAAEAKPSGKGKDKDKEKEKEKEKNATSSTPAPAPAAAAAPTTSKPGSGGPTSRIPSASHTRAATPVVGTTTSEAVAEQSQQMRSSAAPQRPPSRQASEQQKQQQPQQQKPQERERRQSQPSQPPPVSSTTPQPPPQPKKKTSFWGSFFGGDGEGGNDNGGGGGSNTGVGAGTSGSAAPRPSASAGPGPGHGPGPGPAAPVQRKSSSSQLGAGRAGSSRTAPAAGAAAGATQAQTRQSQMSMQSTSALGLVGIEPPRSQSTVITQAELEAEEAARLAEADADIEDAEVLTQRGKGRAQSQVPTQILRRSLVGALDDSSSSSDGPASTGKDSLTTEPDVTQDRLVRALELTRKAVQLNKVISELNFRRSEAMALGKEGVGEMRSIQQEIRKAENKKEKLNGRIESVFKEVNVLDEPPEVLDLSGAGQDPSLSPVQDALEQLLYPGTVSNTIQVKLAKKGGTSSKQRDKLKEFLTELQLEYSYDAPARLMIIKVPNASES